MVNPFIDWFSHEKLDLQLGMWKIAMFDLQCRCTSWIGKSTSSTNTGLFRCFMRFPKRPTCDEACFSWPCSVPTSATSSKQLRRGFGWTFFFSLSFQPCHPVGQKKDQSSTGMYTLMSPEKGLKRMKRLVFQHMFSHHAVDGFEIPHHLGWLKSLPIMGCLPPFSTGAGFRNHPP